MNISFPADLPVSACRDDIAAAIEAHQVVVVAGETGSGKTTQLPKICLALGRGTEAVIGHTQPRRIAARAVAERIAQEIGVELGAEVGYQVRFTDQTSVDTRVKVMTDGVLLNELHRDRDLRRYDTLIIDEAHERSLNIDFLLGYLQRLLPRRPDLKVIITSATIDLDNFATHFAINGVTAPVIEVSGRTYPVDVRYRPLSEVNELDDDGELLVRDLTEGVCEGVAELLSATPGDVLVFLPGEREIRDAAAALEKRVKRAGRSWPALEIVQLYSRLSAAAQHQVFAAHNGRRVVLATNVAETSLTVPGITGVVDSGLARISRWSLRTKVQRLPVEEISQASAKQRSGRCGRIAPGIAIRLYSEADFEARPEFTDPEVLRTSLASVILQLTALRMGEVTRFPFLDPPDPRAVRDAVALLEELGALTNGKLTKVGHTLARLPVDPRMGRMVIEADRLGCLREVLIIVAALSGQDPRERPEQHRARADQLHARFVDPTSDFVSVLNLWRYLKERRSELGSSAFRRLCRDEHLNFIRVREWQDLERQLRQVSRESSMTLAGGETPAPVDSIHQAVLAGLLSHIGVLDRESAAERRATMKKTKSDQSQKRRPGDYRGARGARFSIFPGSGVAQARPDVVMAAEIVETSALWGRQVAAIDPAWAERLAGDLAKRVWEEPHWSQRRASAQAYEKVTLYGVPIVTGRLVPLGKRDPGLARELFIRHALLGGEWRTQHDFLRANALLLRDAAEQEERARRRDIVVDEEILFDFYDERIPANVVSGAHFDTWWKQEHRRRPDLLTFTADMLVRADALADVTEFPDVWRDGERHLPVQYRFEPGHRDDGVTIDIPLDVVGVIVPDQFSWQVEGLREDLVIALLRSLPKPIRVHVVPIPDFARTFLAEVTPGEETMVATLGRHIRTRTGVFVPDDAWDLAAIPEHLRATFRVLDDQGQVISHGKDLTALTRPLIDSSEEAVRVSTSFDRVSGATSWIFGDIPESVRTDRAGREVEAFPALIDEGGAVGLGVFGRLDWAQAQHRRGLRRLAAFRYRDLSDQLTAGLRQGDTLLFASAPDPVKLIASDCVLIAVEVEDPQAVRSAAAFESACPESGQVLDSAQRYFNAVIRVCQRAIEVDKALSGRIDMAALGAMTQMKAQFSSLMSSGFVATAGPRIVDYPRYFEAIMRRAERIGDAARDVNLSRRVDPFQTLVVGGYAALPDNQPPPADLERARWLVEEFRVSLWAQQLGTSEPVSEERLRSLLS